MLFKLLYLILPLLAVGNGEESAQLENSNTYKCHDDFILWYHRIAHPNRQIPWPMPKPTVIRTFEAETEPTILAHSVTEPPKELIHRPSYQRPLQGRPIPKPDLIHVYPEETSSTLTPLTEPIQAVTQPISEAPTIAPAPTPFKHPYIRPSWSSTPIIRPAVANNPTFTTANPIQTTNEFYPKYVEPQQVSINRPYLRPRPIPGNHPIPVQNNVSSTPNPVKDIPNIPERALVVIPIEISTTTEPQSLSTDKIPILLPDQNTVSSTPGSIKDLPEISDPTTTFAPLEISTTTEHNPMITITARPMISRPMANPTQLSTLELQKDEILTTTVVPESTVHVSTPEPIKHKPTVPEQEITHVPIEIKTSTERYPVDTNPPFARPLMPTITPKPVEPQFTQSRPIVNPAIRPRLPMRPLITKPIIPFSTLQPQMEEILTSTKAPESTVPIMTPESLKHEAKIPEPEITHAPLEIITSTEHYSSVTNPPYAKPITSKLEEPQFTQFIPSIRPRLPMRPIITKPIQFSTLQPEMEEILTSTKAPKSTVPVTTPASLKHEPKVPEVEITNAQHEIIMSTEHYVTVTNTPYAKSITSKPEEPQSTQSKPIANPTIRPRLPMRPIITKPMQLSTLQPEMEEIRTSTVAPESTTLVTTPESLKHDPEVLEPEITHALHEILTSTERYPTVTNPPYVRPIRPKYEESQLAQPRPTANPVIRPRLPMRPGLPIRPIITKPISMSTPEAQMEDIRTSTIAAEPIHVMSTISTPLHTPGPIIQPSTAMVTSRPTINIPRFTTQRPVILSPPKTSSIPETTYTGLIKGEMFTSYICKEFNGFYSYENECESYIECKKNVAYKFTCPDGLYFNPNIRYPHYPCSYPTEVKCEATLNKAPQSTAECPRRYGYFALEGGDCSQYIMCQEGLPTILNCSTGLVFNIEKASCDWPVNVPHCIPNMFQGFTCPAPPLDEMGHPTDLIYKYRYGKSCIDYVACQRGHPRFLRCDPGLHFEETLEACVDSDYVKNCEI